MVSLDVFQEQFRSLQEAESGKDKLIEDLICRVRELECGLKEEKLHLEREQEATKAFQLMHHDALFKLKRREEEIYSNSFVSVLIDGDCMMFLDNFVMSAQQGGKDAVHSLRSVVCEYVSTELKLPKNIQIRIRVYANIKGLAWVYCCNDIVRCAESIHMFMCGFNMGYPMCDFVDAGDGKECADSKLGACFNSDLSDVHCRAVLFGGSADNGYARLLQPCIGDDSKSSRIILIEGQSFAKELAGLTNKFPVARFPNVFRTIKLLSRRISFSTTPTTTPIPKATSQVAKVATSVDTSAVNTGSRGEFTVLLNSKGQRLDAIIQPLPSLVYAQRNQKNCNAFHILGECPFLKCRFKHGERLSRMEIEARCLLARQNPCSEGLRCRDEKCLNGHQCPDKACIKVGNGCRFAREMHGVDRF